MQDKYGNEITKEIWESVDLEIKSFIRRYPLHWVSFRNDLSRNQTKYQLATSGDLQKSSFRNTISFPFVMRKKTQEEIDEDPTGAKVEFGESLKDNIERHIPGFVQDDALYKAFIKRYKELFVPGEHY